MSLLFPLLQLRLHDGGPRYTETDLSQFVVEPWNAASAVLFVFIPLYWFIKLKGNYRRHAFMTLMLVILLIGGVGGTLYHAFRVSSIFLYMDWVPIMLICLGASMYFFIKSVGSVPIALGVLIASFLAQWLMVDLELIDEPYASNLSYGLMAITLLAPLWLIMKKTDFFKAKYVGFALLAFIGALSCRIADEWHPLPMGTHFLWHAFGALASHFMLQYTYLLKEAGMLTGVVPPPHR
ncbi:MAG: hypothetical protein AAGI38_06140 [Bacteroidota bacterium]